MSDPVPNHQEYVVGFMFDPTLQNVALIRKTRPKWQAGKVDDGETNFETMVREFQEETGVPTLASQWKYFAQMGGPQWCVDFFATTGNLAELKSTTEERVEIHEVATFAGEPNAVENLPWLLLLAVDHLQDGRPTFASISYPS